MIPYRPLFFLLILLFFISVRGETQQKERHSDLNKLCTETSSEKLMNRARSYINDEEKRDSAMILFNIVANRFYNDDCSERDKDRAVAAMNNLAYMYFFFYQDYFKSYSYLTRSLKLAEEYGFNENIPYIYLNLGNLYVVNGDLNKSGVFHKKALEYYRKSYYEAKKNHNYDLMCLVVTNLLSIYYDDEHIEMLDKELDDFSKLKIPEDTEMLEFSRHLVKAYHFLEAKNYAKAQKECDLAVESVVTDDTPERFVLTALGLKVVALSKSNDNRGALKLLAEMTRIAEKAGAKEFLVDAYRDISAYYSQVGDEESAHKYRMLYLEMKDTMLMENQLQNVGEMQFFDELNTINERMAEANREKEAQTEILRIVILVSIVIVIMLVWLIIAYNRQRKANRSLYEKSVEALQRVEVERDLRRQLQEQVSAIDAAEDKKSKRNSHRNVDEEASTLLMSKIVQVLEDTSVICDPEFSLKKLAELLGDKYWVVSKVINDKRGKNFSALLNDYRINEACRRINDVDNYGRFTIEAISESVGFKSRSNFVAAFKRITGLTPSDYQKLARQQH